jgi:hypothetical protein
MRVRGAERNPFANLKRVVAPRADGAVVGFCGNHPIAAAVVDHWGHRFVYAGAAPRRCDGQYDYEALCSSEWIVEPGLVYASDPEHRGDASTASHHRSAVHVLQDLREALLRWLH